MKKFVLSLFVAFSVGMVGCAGTTGTGTTGGEFTPCTTDTQCASTEACNTIGHVCMTKCSQGSDCPQTSPNCLAVPGGTATVCQCSTDQICGGGSSYCNSVDKLCEVKCSDSATGCQGFSPARTCDAATSTCREGSHNCGSVDCTSTQYCDAATTACVNKCTSNASCTTAGDVCDTGTGLCAPPGNTCTGENTRSTCNYGDVCVSNQGALGCFAPDVCTAVTNPPAISAGHSPVVFSVTRTGNTRQGAACTDANTGNQLTVVEFQGRFYDPDGDATNSGTYSHIMYVTPSGSLKSTYENTSVDVSGGTFKFEICAPTSSIHAGVVLIDQAGHDSNVGCLP